MDSVRSSVASARPVASKATGGPVASTNHRVQMAAATASHSSACAPLADAVAVSSLPTRADGQSTTAPGSTDLTRRVLGSQPLADVPACVHIVREHFDAVLAASAHDQADRGAVLQALARNTHYAAALRRMLRAGLDPGATDAPFAGGVSSFCAETVLALQLTVHLMEAHRDDADALAANAPSVYDVVGGATVAAAVRGFVHARCVVVVV